MCYANPNPLFQPAMRIISNITNGFPAIVTTTFDHNYLSGEYVRLLVPDDFGMIQVNQQVGYIEVLSPTTFSIPLDTNSYDPFVVPLSVNTCSQVCPIGESNEMLNAATHNVLG